MRATRPLTTLAVLAALATATACGSDAGESPTGSGTDDTTLPTGQDEVAVLDVCTLVTAEEVAALVGGTVTKQDQPGGGCGFSQEDPRAASLAFVATAFDEGTGGFDEGTGGFDGAASGVSATIDGTDDQEVPGVGTQAVVSVGSLMGGDNKQAGGLVHLGSSLVQVTLIQAEGLEAEAVRTIAIDALKLVASKA